MKAIVTWALVLALLVMHQDYWQWDRNEIVFGFMPYTMAYNIGVSLATAGLWIIVCTFLWPSHLDDVQPVESGDQYDEGQYDERQAS